MKTAQELKDHFLPFVGEESYLIIENLDVQIYSRMPLTIVIGRHSEIPTIKFVADGKDSGFLVYIATSADTDGPNQQKMIFTWKWTDDIDELLKHCSECTHIQEIVQSLHNFTGERGSK